ncbi:MAG: succinate dehydrogenase/fumarate reductase cytochrome b subunit, partial [Helicobacter sp.]|nr:succinate dehydrogenase/fumarate reductase cytochrome b subunit [Helicobacter sp.]
HQHFWILYIFLLFAVELHASIGLYRLCVKWGWFENLGLETLRNIKKGMSVFFIVLGLLTFGAYVKIGLSQNVSPDTSIEDMKTLDHTFYGKK